MKFSVYHLETTHLSGKMTHYLFALSVDCIVLPVYFVRCSQNQFSDFEIITHFFIFHSRGKDCMYYRTKYISMNNVNHQLSSESEKEYNAASTEDFVACLVNMPGVDGDTVMQKKDVLSQLTSDSDKEYNIDSSWYKELQNIDLDQFCESKSTSATNQNKQVSGNMESSKPGTKITDDTKPGAVGTDQYKTKLRNGRYKNDFETPMSSEKSKVDKLNSSACAPKMIQDSAKTSYVSGKRQAEKLSYSAVVTPHKYPRTTGMSSIKDGCTQSPNPGSNKVVITETLRSVQKLPDDNFLQGDNLYLHKLIISLEKSFFGNKRVISSIPTTLKELNRKVLVEKKIFSESYKSRHNFMLKINVLRQDIKSKNPYKKEYAKLQREEALIPDYDDIVARNSRDLNKTLYQYYKTLKEWMDTMDS